MALNLLVLLFGHWHKRQRKTNRRTDLRIDEKYYNPCCAGTPRIKVGPFKCAITKYVRKIDAHAILLNLTVESNGNILLFTLGFYLIAERVSVRQLLRVVFSRYAYVRVVTLKNVN